ncbi:MAG: hypothetical protein ACM319_05035 [Deltaproteobacteria bacterium]
MIRILRFTLAVALLVSATWGIADAETILSVNDCNTGVFDQPNATFLGPTVYVVFIGGDTVAGPFRVFFAAVNGGADYTNLQLARDNTVLPIPPFAIDGTGAGGNSPYFDARHPKVALRTGSEAVILFQAKPTAADNVYRPYIARVAFTATTATLISVQQIAGFPAGALPNGDNLSTGDIEDLSFNLVPADNTVRMAFSSRDAIASAAPFHVYFARAGLDTATVVGTPLLLSSGTNDTVTGSDGFRPTPSLRLDALNRSHVAWAANSSTPAASGIYYALVNSTATTDNVAIGATQVITQPLAWGHPSVMAPTTSNIVILAADETIPGKAGSIGIVSINPDAVGVVQNGLPVSIGIARSFLLLGPNVLEPNFKLYRPEAFLDTLGQIHLTGYGSSGTTATYYSFRLATVSPFASFVTAPDSVGFNSSERPAELSGDYTQAAFAVLNGKTIVFWSGQIPGSANRNLDFTAKPNSSLPSSDGGGCSMARDPRAGDTGKIPEALLLFLPAAVLALRRTVTRIRRYRETE